MLSRSRLDSGSRSRSQRRRQRLRWAAAALASTTGQQHDALNTTNAANAADNIARSFDAFEDSDPAAMIRTTLMAATDTAGMAGVTATADVALERQRRGIPLPGCQGRCGVGSGSTHYLALQRLVPYSDAP
jgi:hypothetical protein